MNKLFEYRCCEYINKLFEYRCMWLRSTGSQCGRWKGTLMKRVVKVTNKLSNIWVSGRLWECTHLSAFREKNAKLWCRGHLIWWVGSGRRSVLVIENTDVLGLCRVSSWFLSLFLSSPLLSSPPFSPLLFPFPFPSLPKPEFMSQSVTATCAASKWKWNRRREFKIKFVQLIRLVLSRSLSNKLIKLPDCLLA